MRMRDVLEPSAEVVAGWAVTDAEVGAGWAVAGWGGITCGCAGAGCAGTAGAGGAWGVGCALLLAFANFDLKSATFCGLKLLLIVTPRSSPNPRVFRYA